MPMDLFTPKRRVAFDIETANIVDLKPGEDLDDHGPFDISCAAAIDNDGAVRHWTTRNADGGYAPHFDAATAHEMLTWLRAEQVGGARLFAWNGLSFDLRWLGVAANDVQLAAEIALDLYDPMFQFFVKRGFPVGLGKVAEGLELSEAKLMDGAEAPKEWAAGHFDKVLEYVAGDCRITDQVVAAIEAAGAIKWRTRKGTISQQAMPELLCVRDLIHAPEADTSWMDTPIPRTKFTGWLPEELLPPA